MAGVGVRLNRIFEKKSIAADIAGFTYSIVITIAPTLVVILGILLMGRVLGFDEVSYLDRELWFISRNMRGNLQLGGFCRGDLYAGGKEHEGEKNNDGRI